MSSAEIGDAGAVACVIGAGFSMPFTTQKMHVAVELAGGHTRGMTVVDARPDVSPPDIPQLPANVDVIVQVDANQIKRIFANAVLLGDIITV